MMCPECEKEMNKISDKEIYICGNTVCVKFDKFRPALFLEILNKRNEKKKNV
jgi:hypothetical protein